MTQSNNLKINLVEQSQSQKEVTINEAIATLEAVQNRGIKDKDLSTPPVSPSAGDSYIIKATATGAWIGKENYIAYYNSGWRFIQPNEGLLVWVSDEDKVYVFDGSTWKNYADNLQNLEKLGVNATADTTNRLTVASDTVLFNTATGDNRVKINKSTSSNTASILMQNNFSGRAEIGIIGSDDFKFKVSADGSTFYDGITLDRTNGNANMNNGLLVGSGAVVKKLLSATAALDFPNISANTSSDLTISVTGATNGSASTVILGLPDAPTAGIIYSAWVSAINTVTVRAFNVTGSAINPASQTFRVTVLTF